MAKQAGPYYLTGCYDNICFYKMEGRYYARQKSSLKGKRVKRDAAFKETMRYAALLGCASKLASKLYHDLPKESKGVGVYRSLTGRIMPLLKLGKTATEVLNMLKRPAAEAGAKRKASAPKPMIASQLYADVVIESVFNSSVHAEERLTMKLTDIAPP
jgi:hypothetical protein